MSDGGEPRAAPWRVVVFTDFGPGQFVPQVHPLLTAHGHRLVGVVTGPGPKKRHSDDYLEVVRSVPPGIDVLVTTHMGRLAALLAPLRPDLIMSAGFKWRVPPEVLRLPSTSTPGSCPSAATARSTNWATSRPRFGTRRIRQIDNGEECC